VSDRCKITGLWVKDLGEKGKMIGGKVDRGKLEDALAQIGTPQINVAVFKNGFKDSDSKPDYILYLSPWEDRKAAAPPKPAPEPDFDPDEGMDF